MDVKYNNEYASLNGFNSDAAFFKGKKILENAEKTRADRNKKNVKSDKYLSTNKVKLTNI